MIFTLVFFSFLALIFFPSIKALLSKPLITPEELKLNSVRDALMEKRGWDLGRAEAARAEYIRFLTLLQMKPGFMMVPWPNAKGEDDLDQFWHQHILDTLKYAEDCNRLFGRMIHHNPHVVRGSGQETSAVEKTQRLYTRTFNSGTYGRPADTAWLTGCGACATADTGSSSHDGGGHGDGGHGCGHGCGGHGCGSCGGH